MVLNGNHNLCVLNEFSCIIEKRGVYKVLHYFLFPALHVYCGNFLE